MADSVYPGDLDTDIQIPRVDDNITEIGGEAINGLRSAIFNIEATLGLDPQGTAADLAARLNVSMNPDGSLKASALASIGLVTLPITNSQIAPNAGIEESKLDLDFSTVTLRTLIANLEAFAEAINQNLLQDIGNLNQHIAHPGAYGRHQTRDIDGYIGKYATYNLQGIIEEIDDTLVDHIDSTKVGAHVGENISIDDSLLNINADNVQEAVSELDELQDTLLIQHRDDFHSNGILRAQETFIDGYNHAGTKVASAALNSIVGGDSFVQYSSPPSELATVSRGDIIDVSSGTQIFRFYVDRVNTITGEVTFFGKVPVSISGPTAIIYSRTDETNAVSNLVLTRRQSNSIQMVHPGAAFVLSHRADPRKITSAVNLLRFRWHDGETGDIDVKDALETYVFSKPSTWTIENLVVALNEYFRSYSVSPFKRPTPLIAFSYKGEFGIAYDEVNADAYVEVVTPNVSANSASAALGLIEGTANFGLGPRRVSIDGYQVSAVRQKIITSGQATGNSIDTFPVGVDVLGAGLEAGDLVRVYGGTNANNKGGFIANAVSAAAVTFTPSPGFITETVNFKAWDDVFTLATTPGIPTLYELFADDYNGQEIRLQGSVRLTYQQAGASSENLEQIFDVVDVSRNFGKSSRRIYFDLSANTLTLGQIGVSDKLLADTEGESVILPSTVNAAGFRFKLYDNNNTDYLEIQVANPNYLSFLGDAALDVEIYDRIREDKFLQLGIVLHNTTEFRHLSDRRLFGNIGRADVRDDFTRDYISYPASVLRSKGVLYGMEVLSRNDGNIDAYGGEVFVDGSISVLPTRDIAIPQDNETTTYNLFVEGGRLHLLRDDQVAGTNGSIIASPSFAEIVESNDKLLLAQIDTNASNQIQEIRDYRRFVNNLDDKMELIVEENTITNGAFPTMRGALNWISAMDAANIPVSRVIKVRGTIDVDVSDGSLSVPEGVTIEGDSQSVDENTTRPTINFLGTGADAFVVEDGVTFKNLLFTSDAASSLNESVFVADDVTNLTLKACHFENIRASGFFYLVSASSTLVNDCLIEDCFINSDVVAGFGIVGLIASAGSVRDVVIRGTNIRNTIASTSPFLISCNSNLERVKILGCRTNFDLANSNNFGVIATTVDDLQISDCEFDLGVSTGSVGSVVYANTINSTIITNNIINHSTANTNNYIVLGTVALNNCVIANNYFYRTSTVAATITGTNVRVSGNTTEDCVGTFVSIQALVNGDVSNNIVRYSSAVSSNLFLNATSSATGAVIANNFVKYAARFVRMDIANRVSITSNITESLDDEFIFTDTISNSIVKGNVIDKSGADEYGIHVSVVANDLLVDGNFLECTSGLTSDKSMFYAVAANSLVISNNIFKNAGATGFDNAIRLFESSSNLLISNNILSDYTRSESYLIHLDEVSNVLISDNMASGIDGAIRISGNNIQGVGILSNSFVGSLASANTSFVYVLGVDDISGVSISNNTLKKTAATLSSNIGTLASLNNSSLCIMSGNYIELGHTGSSFFGALESGIDMHVTNNTVVSANGGTCDEVLRVLNPGSTETVASFNNVRAVDTNTAGDPKIEVPSDATDYMNWGQPYEVLIPISNSTAAGRDTGGSSDRWIFQGSGSQENPAYAITSSTGLEEIVIEFGSEHVPQGAKVTAFTVVHSSASSMSTWRAKMIKSDSAPPSDDGVDVTVWSGLTVSTSPTFNVIPVSDEIIRRNRRYGIAIDSDVNSGGSSTIFQIVIHYTL